MPLPAPVAHRAALAFVLPCLLVTLMPVAKARAQIPEEFTNLQILDEDIERRELIDMMRGFCGALDVRCNHCHVGENARTLEGFDWASDAKASKRAARDMIQMTRLLNETWIPKVEGHEGDHVQVTCVTCHRGQERPFLIQDLLERTLEKDGPAGVRDQYAKLRAEYYGRHTYDFGELVLTSLAEKWARRDRGEAALELLEMNLEHYPESVYTLILKAGIQASTGDLEGARSTARAGLELDPENPRLQQMLQQLESDR